MRVLAAVFALSCCVLARKTSGNLPRALLTKLGIKDQTPAHRLLECSFTLGPAKCFSALSVFRAEHALEALETGKAFQFDPVEDARQFPWQMYSNKSDEQLYSQLYDGTEKLLRYRSLSFTLPGYEFELESKGNGTLNVDILKNDDVGEGRTSIKKLYKQFYNIMPLLLLPGLVMSAILPFVLPALKLMTVGVGMLNNMALSGAVFTLLRNNAFNDKYEHRIIYINEGYKNEKTSPVFIHENIHEHVEAPIETMEYGASNVNEMMSDNNGYMEVPSDADFINQYYGNEDMKLRRSSQRKPEKGGKVNTKRSAYKA